MTNPDEIRVVLILSRRQAKFALAVAAVCGLSGLLYSETVTLSAIYPSPSGLYKKLLVTTDALLGRDAGAVRVGACGAPRAGIKLDVCGPIRVIDGSANAPAAGKVLTADDNGVASWQYPTYAP